MKNLQQTQCFADFAELKSLMTVNSAMNVERNYNPHLKTFSNVLQVRTISAEYLVAMKLMAGRKYKNDLSDVVGIIIEQENKGKTISIEVVKKAVIDLYDRYENISVDSRKFIEAIYEQEDLITFLIFEKEYLCCICVAISYTNMIL